jgi:hypothetical protein
MCCQGPVAIAHASGADTLDVELTLLVCGGCWFETDILMYQAVGVIHST